MHGGNAANAVILGKRIFICVQENRKLDALNACSNSKGRLTGRTKQKKMNLEQWCVDNNMRELLLEWDYDANRADPKCPDTPKDCPYGSPRDVHWVCSRCGNKWPAAPATRRIGKGVCKKCIDRLLIPGENDLKTWCNNHDKQYLLEDWDYSKNKADPECPSLPEEIRYNQAVSVHWKCHLCGNEWPEKVNNRTKRNFQCQKCANTIRAKNQQKKVRNIETGEVFDSIKDAELKYSGKVGTNICQCLKGVHKTAYGYHWEYVEDK